MKRLSLVLSFLLMASCMTTSKDLPKKALKLKDRLYVGRVYVEMNGEAVEKCEITINNDLVPHIRLGEDHWVVYKTDRQKVRFSHIKCLHRATPYLSAWHEQALPLGNLVRSDEHTTIVSFGDIYLKWFTEEGETKRIALSSENHQSRYKQGQKKNSGEIKVEVKPAMEDAKAFLNQAERGQKFQTYNWQESIVGLQ